MKPQKCIFVIGPESSGSKLAAKICAHVLKIQDYGDWDGTAWSNQGVHKVCHRSLPYGIPPQFPDIDKWITENQANYEIYFVLTTRDISMSERSRFERWSKPAEQARKESAVAKKIMSQVIHSQPRYFVFSYETFMFLDKAYLKLLYEFLGIQSEFIPHDLIDGNKNKLIAP